MFYLIVTLLLILAVIIAVNFSIEPFYSYFPPSNCMQNVFGKTTCYPPGYYPFYTASYYWPFYPYWYTPYYYKSPYWPLDKKKIIIKKK